MKRASKRTGKKRRQLAVFRTGKEILEAEVYAMDDGGMIINSDQGDCLYYVHQDMDEQRRMPKKPGFFARALNWLKGE
jgi:hypothetical protein